MTAARAAAYRYLLYHAFIDIRTQCGWAFGPKLPRRSLRGWFTNEGYRSAHKAACLSDAFHNLAHFSVWNFDRFDEARWWSELETSARRGNFEVGRYRRLFEDELE